MAAINQLDPINEYLKLLAAANAGRGSQPTADTLDISATGIPGTFQGNNSNPQYNPQMYGSLNQGMSQGANIASPFMDLMSAVNPVSKDVNKNTVLDVQSMANDLITQTSPTLPSTDNSMAGFLNNTPSNGNIMGDLLGNLIGSLHAYDTKNVTNPYGLDLKEQTPTPWMMLLRSMAAGEAPEVSKILESDAATKSKGMEANKELLNKLLVAQMEKAGKNTVVATKTYVDKKTGKKYEGYAVEGKGIYDALTSQKLPDTVEEYLKPTDHTSSDENRKLREEINVQRRLDEFGKRMSPALAVRSTIGVAQQGLARIKRLQALAKDPSKLDPNNLPQIQTEELAIGLNSILQGSNQSAKTQVEQLVPSSAQGDFQKIKSWILNEPLGLKQQKFIELIRGALDREEKANAGIIKDLQRTVIPNYTDLENDPKFDLILGAAGYTREEYDALKKNKFLPPENKDNTNIPVVPPGTVSVIGQDSKTKKVKLSTGEVITFDEAKARGMSW